MKNWEKALGKFLLDWKDREDVTGAIVCGSYVTGNPSSHSDVDLHIILSSDCDWRERGNIYVDGLLIEYFVNPVRQHYAYMKEDFEGRLRINAHMFVTGRVLFDKTGELTKLIEDSRRQFEVEFKKPGAIPIELSKYHLWDMLDNLEEISEKESPEFDFVYYNYLKNLYSSYSAYLSYLCVPVHKVFRFLRDSDDRKKYMVEDFPDRLFMEKFIQAVSAKDNKDKMSLFRELSERALDEMGGFNVNGWKLRTPVEV